MCRTYTQETTRQTQGTKEWRALDENSMKYRIAKWENIVILFTLCPLMAYAAVLTIHEMYITGEPWYLIGLLVLMLAAATKIVSTAVVLIFKDGFRKIE